MRKIKKSRLKEPSTYAGISAIAASLTTALPIYAPIFLTISAISGGIAMMLREGNGE